ncbi:MAG: aminotransferase class III-fold pyridoxal phosphate-dependent enzyme [Actinomycetota bacterium]|nr:aminotransferase class III-fold pyridoxal phosphate-dependent enzyme [Actinomycetota bacterium]
MRNEIIEPAGFEKIARDHFGIKGRATPLPGEIDSNARIDSPTGESYFLRVVAERNLARFEFVQSVMNAATRTSYATPIVLSIPDGSQHQTLDDGRVSLLYAWVEGTTFEAAGRPPSAGRSIGMAAAEMVLALEPMDMADQSPRRQWNLLSASQTIEALNHHIRAPRQAALIQEVLVRLSALDLSDLPMQVIHNDLNGGNILIVGDEVVGVIDFGDAARTIRIGELAIACMYAMLDQDDPINVARDVVAGYQSLMSIEEREAACLFDLVLARLATSVCNGAERLEQTGARHDAADMTWDLLDRLLTADTDSMASELEACALGREFSVPVDDMADSRQIIGPSLRLAYDNPIHFVKGTGQFLFDSRARRYLDCVNNIAHVGHSNPKVTTAAASQMAILNTNTRYLHGELPRYARRLTATLPKALDTVFLVNSGSEANELAIRLARTATGRFDIVCLDHGYHGNTTTLIDVSPYKFNGSGGQGRQPWVHVLPATDGYRNKAFTGENAGSNYRAAAEAVVRGTAPAALIAEALQGCGGQTMPADAVLAAAYGAVRDAGGLVIADEVQTGFGRVGSAFWSFQLFELEPDIVTIGKPAGNGHPLGAVITTRAIAEAFDNGMEYFNSFGGNPVSAAVGNAVLDVIEDDDLQAHAALVGSRLMNDLRNLATAHEAIGEVRGSGLFIGIDLVLDRTTREPAPELARRVVGHAVDAGVLLSTDGPGNNVLKIKPPMIFDQSDAAKVVNVIDEGIAQVQR